MARDANADQTAQEQADAAALYAEAVERMQRISREMIERQDQTNNFMVPDPSVIMGAFMRWGMFQIQSPEKIVDAQMRLMMDYAKLWQHGWERMLGKEADPLYVPETADRRFKDDAWTESAVFDLIKQTYLLYSGWLQSTVSELEGPDSHTHHMVRFYAQEFVDAIAPSNFVATNPVVLQETASSGGVNLMKGLNNLLDDLEKGHGHLKISMTRYEAFEVGSNLAVTPGKVVYQNGLMQLVQYTPTTEQVYRVPLLIVPPWINKFYILDMRERNSVIKWLVDQGFTVFIVSWVNPDETLSHKRFDDYMLEGPLTAMAAVKEATGETDVNLVGYCIGGTLTAATLSYLEAKGHDRVRSATFLTCMLDFSEPGDLGVFIDDEQLALVEEHMEKLGYLEGHHMAHVFNLMRANDLIWNFVVNNYLMGREPFPFDLLYWNADSTRMPKMMHSFYLRNMYQDNLLIEPGRISLDGVPIDLGQVKTPAYFLSTREDHIAPWLSTYRGTQVLGGPVRFVLAASGHIAGVINPPVANKYCYWTRKGCPQDPQRWLGGAEQHEGSWWPDWARWLARKSEGKVAARQPGDGDLPVIEDAPGSYVKVRIGD